MFKKPAGLLVALRATLHLVLKQILNFRLLVLLLVMPCAAAFAAAPTQKQATLDPFWQTFHHAAITLDGVKIHYVEGGQGAPVLLIPGWPESWYAWRMVMPALVASGHRVIAIDPRGMGDSSHPRSGYDTRTVAAEIHRFIAATGLARDAKVDVVGHDVGAWIAYALAADWPGDVRRLTVMEAALPGITPPNPAGIPTDSANTHTWHFAFNRLDDLPEILVEGHERAYLNWIFQQKANRSWVFTPEVMDEYVRVYTLPGGTRAAFSYYREAFSNAGLKQNVERAQIKLAMPVLAIGGQFGVGDAMANTMKSIANDVSGKRLEGCGHFVLEECPEAVASALHPFLSMK
ncbi:alpha/beta fold hydrolase [Massilia sp. CMS3.1]|uniref:alpha/beta fold hydrolase n=1 Tax=Massilia sp. CMS3.1 TaxID=3373083 RepID=UPI003EE4E4FF